MSGKGGGEGARNKPARGEQSKSGERQLHPLYRVIRFQLPLLPECLRAFYMWSYSDIHVIK